MILLFRNSKEYYARKLGYGIGADDNFKNRVEDWNNIYNINYWDFRKIIRRISLLECISSNRFSEYMPCWNRRWPRVMRKEWAKRHGQLCHPRDDDDITNITDHQLEIITRKLKYADIIKGRHCEIRYNIPQNKVLYSVWNEERWNKLMPTSSYIFKINKKHVYPKMVLPLYQIEADDYYSSEGVRTEVLNSHISLAFHGPASLSTLRKLESKDSLVNSIDAWKNIDSKQIDKIHGRFLQPFLARMEVVNSLKLN